MTEERKLTFGEKAVGLNFNPSGENEVTKCKQGFANEIDRMNNLRLENPTREVLRMTSIAITQLQTAQMWAVKAITWRE